MATSLVTANGINLSVTVEGPEDGHPVLLLHGFPDSSFIWRHQIAALSEAGYRTIAPDQRGYGASDAPEDVDAYAIPNLAMDAAGVLDALGIERASVVGHDWGASVAWLVATIFPDRVERLCTVSVGHPAAFFSAGGFAQREKSWYMLFYQAEGIAEEWLSRDGFANLRALAQNPVDFDRNVADMSKPGRLTAALNWYRATTNAAAFAAPPLELPPVACPTMGVWSSGDYALTEVQMTASAEHVTGPWRYERIEGVGHDVPAAAPDQLNALLLDFLP
ncbi:MAG: alpha/beta fold hydrolase [Acidimicrobiia bacterium]